MVLGAEGDDWSITTLPGSADVMNDSRASFSVSEVNAKDAPESCKLVKMFFLGFSRHTEPLKNDNGLNNVCTLPVFCLPLFFGDTKLSNRKQFYALFLNCV